MNDDLGLFADESGEPPRGRKARREERERFRRRRRSRWITAVAGLFVVVLVGLGVLYGASQILQLTNYEDYDGEGSGRVVIEVESGDTVSAIANTLAEKDVVASPGAFVAAAEDNPAINSIQPGFYLMRSQMSGAAAVRRILSPDATAGRVDIRAGSRLEDQLAPDGGRTPGILTQLAEATCVGEAKQQCVSSEEMHQVAASADLAQLGVPEWAIGPASQAPPKRRLEGLILPDVYDIEPGASAQEVLRSVITRSAAKLEAVGLPGSANGTGHSPYELLTIASLVQSEGKEKDFPQISRVVHNRLTPPTMKLELDSTINYPLDKPSLLTNPEDRHRPGEYNTYLNFGLPRTPISAPSQEALNAALKPADGKWKFFVKCYPDGTSCFAVTNAEHEVNKRKAEERGAY